ncbi:MAG: uroporphyrinogen-III synthase, partial [Anaerolineales bacterium]|nr:uroporphyrinogen-III synthase [Anaerolineales bacterium]
THVVAYETVRGSGGVDLPELLTRGTVDAVTLASSSAFTFLCERLTQVRRPAALHQVCLAVSGTITARTVRKPGHPAVVSPQRSLEGPVAALASIFDC